VSDMGGIVPEQSFYRFRLIFSFPSSGVITPREGEADEQVELQCAADNGQIGTLCSIGFKPLSQTDEFEFSLGGFKTAEEAWNEAQELVIALRVLCADQEIGVDIGKVDLGGYSEESAAEGTARFSEGLFGEMPTERRQQVISYKRGVTVVKQPSADYGYKTVGFKGDLNLRPFSMHGIFAAWINFAEQKVLVNERTSLALELYNAAFFEHSMRARFLTWILMLESMAKPEPRSPEIIALVSEIAAMVKAAKVSWPIGSDDRSFQGIASTLSYMKSESITQSLQKLAEDKAAGLTFATLEPAQFIKKCYVVRSSLVHNGSTGLDESEFHKIVHQLQKLAIHILRSTLGVNRLNVPDEWCGLLKLEAQIIV
jgi:hypothetical protein